VRFLTRRILGLGLRWSEIWLGLGLGFSESRERRGRSSWSWPEEDEERERRDEVMERDSASEEFEASSGAFSEESEGDVVLRWRRFFRDLAEEGGAALALLVAW